MSLPASLRLGASALALSAASIILGSAPAKAECVLSGGTVTCASTDDDGFIGGDNLTVNIQSGAFVQSVYDANPSTFCPSFRSALRVGSGTRITNAGSLLGRGNCGLGIDAQNGLVLTNTGSIQTDAEVAFAVLAINNFDVTNSGFIQTVNSFSAAFVGGNTGRFTNTASGRIETTGSDSAGIFAENSNAITNQGAIRTIGSGGVGIDAGANNSITNSGTITTTGIASPGIRVRGSGNTITNSGTISTLPTLTPRDGENSIGIQVDVGGNTITNSGTINGDYAGVAMFGTENSLVNNGLITARAPSSATLLGGGVIVGGGGTATIINNQNSTIRGVGSAAIRVRSDTALTLTNSGTINGEIILGDVGSTLRFIGGTITAPVRGSTLGTDTLTLEGNGTITQPILNFDRLQKRGVGQWTFTTSSGGVNVNGPVDIIDGLLQTSTIRATRITVGRNAQLTGPITMSGVLGSASPTTTLIVDGTIYPGNSASPNQEVMAVQGNVLLNATAVVESRLSATFGDVLNATGQITIAGGTLNVKNGMTPPRDGQVYTLMAAANIRSLGGGSCSGTLSDTGTTTGTPCLDQLTDVWPTFIRSTATVSGTAVTVTLQRIPYASMVTASEAIAVASYLDQARASVGGLFGLIPVLDQMTEETARAAFTTYSSDVPVSLITWNILSGDALVNAANPWLNVPATDSPKGDFRSWGSLTARAGQGAPLGDAGHFDYETKGVVAGLDYAIADGTRIGLIASHAQGETFFVTGSAQADLDSSSLGLYLTHAQAQWRASVGALLGDGTTTMTRQRTTFGGLVGTIAATTNTSTDIGFAQSTYVMDYDVWSLSPTARLTYIKAKTDAYRESSGMRIGAQNETSWRGDLGVNAEYDAGPVRVHAGAYWSHNFADNDRVVSADEFLQPGSAFLISGQTEKRGWLKTQAGASFDFTPSLTGTLAWTGILNDRLGGHSATAGLSYRW